MTINPEPSVFRIPENRREALVKLLNFTDDQFQQLIASMDKAYDSEDLYLFEELIQIDGLDPSENDSIVDLIRDFNLVRDNSEMKLNDFVKEFSSAIISEEDVISALRQINREEIQRRVQALVSSEPTSVLLKARRLALDDLNELKGISIITDLRPVFDSEGNEIKAFIEVHKLNLLIEEGEQLRTEVVSLTNEDLQNIVKVAQRALKKSRILESSISKEGKKYFKTFGETEVEAG